jgi:oligoendopeptidase F
MRIPALVIPTALFYTLPFLASAGQAADPAERYTWELTSIYPTEAAWEVDRRAILDGIARLPRLQGKLSAAPAALLAGLDEISNLRVAATRMEIYGELAHNLDAKSAEAERRFQVGSELLPRVDAAAAFAGDEVLRVGPARLDEWYRSEPRLERHRIRITRILREAPHTLPGPEQAIVASMARWPNLSSDVWDALHESDLGWNRMKDASGREVAVTLASVRQFPPERRAESARALMSRLSAHAGLFGILYTRRIEADLTIARHRRFADGIDAIWFLRDGMPEGSAGLVVEEARRNLPLLHRYLQVRARALGFAKPSYAQLYVPAPDAGQTFDAESAIRLAREVAAPLGNAFQNRIDEAVRDRWMHLPAWTSKRGVFEIFPAIGMAHPYMLTSYRPTYRGARQVSGALFDLIKDADIPADRYPDWRDDPPIYGNGIIYVGDMLFDDLVRGRAKDAASKLACAVHALDLLWSNFFQTASIMELDTRVQKLIADGNPPSGEEVSRIYRSILRDYAGEAEVDEVFGAEWMTYGTTFFSHEHQFWAGAIAAAAEIVEKIRAGDPNGPKAVDGVFGRGDSDRSYFLLKQAGIDMATRAPYESLMRRFRALLDEAETLGSVTKR